MTERRFHRPAETAQHAGVIMSWPTRASILETEWPYAGADVTSTREDIARLAKAIAKYEPVHVFVPDLQYNIDPKDTGVQSSAERLLKSTPNVTIHTTPNVDCLWARDTGPMFIREVNANKVDNTFEPSDEPGVGFGRLNTSTSTVGLQMNFNQWGRKELPSPDTYFAPTACQAVNVSCLLAPFVAEGGAIEVDGHGTFVATEASFINPNRNPGLTKAELERHLSRYLGITKFIWIPGRRGADITDDHIDALVRFTEIPGTVVLTRPSTAGHSSDASAAGDHRLSDYHEAKAILEASTDARGHRLRVITIDEPDPSRVFGKTYDPAAGHCVAYVNFLVGNGAVFMSKFGDEERDAAAAKTIADVFPSRAVVQLELLQIARQGGGIHCSTQHFFTE